MEHSEDIIESMDRLIDSYEELIKEGKAYKGEDIILIFTRMKLGVRHMFGK